MGVMVVLTDSFAQRIQPLKQLVIHLHGSFNRTPARLFKDVIPSFNQFVEDFLPSGFINQDISFIRDAKYKHNVSTCHMPMYTDLSTQKLYSAA